MDGSFGSLLRDKRRAAGLSQRELADRAGLAFSYISKLENGRLPPPAADTVVALCDILQVSPDELLALTGKLPTDVQQTVTTSKTAQRFLREAGSLRLTDEEWERMRIDLHSLRKERL